MSYLKNKEYIEKK